MAKKKVPGKPFEPGPDSRRDKGFTMQPATPETKPLRKFSRTELTGVLLELMITEDREVEEIAKGYGRTSLEKMVASIIVHAWQTGDNSRLEGLFNRVIGKVGEHFTVKDERESADVQAYLAMTLEQRRIRVRELVEICEYKRKRELEIQAIGRGEIEQPK